MQNAHVRPVEQKDRDRAPPVSLTGRVQGSAATSLVGIRPVHLSLVRDAPHYPLHVAAGGRLKGVYQIIVVGGVHQQAALPLY